MLHGDHWQCAMMRMLRLASPADRGFLLPISGGSNLLAVYSANASAVVLAFGGTNDTLANVTASNPLETDAFYKGAFSNQGNGSVDPYLADPFYGRIGGGYDGLYRVCRLHIQQIQRCTEADLDVRQMFCEGWLLLVREKAVQNAQRCITAAP